MNTQPAKPIGSLSGAKQRIEVTKLDCNKKSKIHSSSMNTQPPDSDRSLSDAKHCIEVTKIIKLKKQNWQFHALENPVSLASQSKKRHNA